MFMFVDKWLSELLAEATYDYRVGQIKRANFHFCL